MSTFTPPPAMTRLLNAALTHGRSYQVQHHTDTADNPFVTVKILWPGIPGYQPHQVDATWHTRGTGTYRLMHVAGAWARCDHQQLTLTRAIQFVTGEWVPQQVADLTEQTAHRDDPDQRGTVDVHLPA